MKLLLGRPAKSIFWLPRDARRSGELDVSSICELSGGARAAFFELYGDDVSNGVLSLVSMLESPHYAEWLAECAKSCGIIERRDPGGDPQLGLVLASIPDHPESVVLDVGAGVGDLLTAITTTQLGSAALTYLAFDPKGTDESLARLQERIVESIHIGAIGPNSRLIGSLAEAPAACDLIALCNVCHAIPIPELAREMAMLLCRHLRPKPGATLLIIEVRTLGSGEGPFFLWTPEEWATVLSDLPGLKLDHATLGNPGHPEGIDATLLRWAAPLPDLGRMTETIESRLWGVIPGKRVRALDELAERQQSWLAGHDEAWRQRRVAFLCAQLAWLLMAERAHETASPAAVS